MKLPIIDVPFLEWWKKVVEKVNMNEAPAVPVQLPSHLYIPANSDSIDISAAAEISASSTGNLILRYKAPRGKGVRFINYGIYNDGLDATLLRFLPKVNGKKILDSHGNPILNFRLSLGLAPDLGNNSLRYCSIYLNPEDEITWEFDNNDTVPVTAGVRMVGYTLDSKKSRAEAFGG